MSELRKDPIVDRWVIVAESRSLRPGAFLESGPRAMQSPPAAGYRVAECPFCAGNEARTPPAVYEQLGADGGWQVRIVPNRYPAVISEAKPADEAANPSPALGVHEVVVESPDHATDLTQLSRDQLTRVLKAWRDRLAEHRREGRWQAVLLFKNAGREAGASLEHVHSQIVALPRIPELIGRELVAADAAYLQHGECAFCRFVASERESGDRVLLEEAGYVALMAYAGRQAYETWILPCVHRSAYDYQNDDSLAGLASVLAQLLQSFAHVLPICTYNLVLHTAPFDTCWDDRYHWHIEIVPRVSGLAGYELGGGEYINPVSPERAAREIKEKLTASGKL